MRWPSSVPLADVSSELAAGVKKIAKNLAQIEGEIKTPGLKEPVEVLRDRQFRHLRGRTPTIFLRQGFVAAFRSLFGKSICALPAYRRAGRSDRP